MAEHSAKQLGLSKSALPHSIIEVIATLNRSGFDAYIVGGGVRDTLLGLSPKDFDAVTNAKPHEIKDVFGKRCRIIGRRFQLAHVYSGKDLIEVATFRAPPKDDTHTTEDGMLTRDNVWGDILQDFARRDFSINALYYQPLKGIVHDFCNALDDIQSKTLRLLGKASKRIEEDPVRLLRALRFRAKLGFEFDDELANQFHDDNWILLDQVSPHRLYDETQKMFRGGYIVPLLPMLFDYGAIKHLIIYPPEKPSRLLKQVAINTDNRICAGKSINPAFFYAALLWDNYLYQLNQFKKKNLPFAEAQQQAAAKVIDRQRIKTAIPKFAEQFISDIWLLQPKLSNPKIKHIQNLAEHPRFRAAFDFLLLREQCDDAQNPLSESTNGMGAWWQHYQTLSDKQKKQAIDQFANRVRQGSQGSQNGQASKRNRNRKIANIGLNELPADITICENSNVTPHHQKEKAQLQMLSLADGQSPAHQPSPLFVVDKAVSNGMDNTPADYLLDSHQEKTSQDTTSQPKIVAPSAAKKEAKAEQTRPAKTLTDFGFIESSSTIPERRKRRQNQKLKAKAKADDHNKPSTINQNADLHDVNDVNANNANNANNVSPDAKTSKTDKSHNNTSAKNTEATFQRKPPKPARTDGKPSKLEASDTDTHEWISKSEPVPERRQRRKTPSKKQALSTNQALLTNKATDS